MDEGDKIDEKNKELDLSPNKDDSLADFKSPKTESVQQAINKPRILNDKRAKKSSSKSKTSATSRKKSTVATVRRTNNEPVQPSIESSFFKASTSANKAGHTCPLCMKYFADKTAGNAHSKNCATKNNVSTEKLLAAVALQERQAHERIAIGLPAGPLLQPKTKTPRRNRELVVSNADPDLQLALALSESLQENELEKDFEEALMLAVEHRGEDPIVEITNSQKRQTLKNFGFSTNKPAASGLFEGPVKSRRKKHLGPTVLQTRTKESRDRILSDRIAEILMGNEAITQVSPKANPNKVEKSKSKLQSRLLSKIHQSAKRLWDSAQLSTEITNFYVEDLGPVVLPCKDRQEESSSNQNVNEEDSQTKRAKADSPERLNEKPSESDKNVATKKPEISTNCVNESRNNSSPETRNIYVTDRQYRNTLTADWSNALNSSSMSDVVVLVKNSHIWAHKLVFHVRCSDLLLDCEPTEDAKFGHVKEKICWLDIDSSTGMAFLEFVYSGVIEKNSKILNDNRLVAAVRRLARKYRLKDLFDYLRKRKTEIDDCPNVENRREGLSSPIIVDAGEFQNEEEKQRVAIIQGKDIRTKGIQENQAERIGNQENDGAKNETKEIQIETSPGEKLLEVFVPKSNLPGQENDNDHELEMMEVISISSSHRASTMSPDLFDETINESKEIAEGVENMEASTGATSQVSIEENSNLKVLAQLIDDDMLSSDGVGQEFSPPTSPETRIENKIPAEMSDVRPPEDYSSDEKSGGDHSVLKFGEKNMIENGESKKIQNSTATVKITDCKSLSQSNLETPKSRGLLFETTKMTELSKSQRLPERQKSNLSLFIEKIRKINSKSAADSDSEGESLGIAVDRRRFRNPFNVNNVSNQAVKTCDEMKNDESHENVENETSNLDESSIDESLRLEENDDINSIDDTFSTGDENISMYSKYKKNNKHNNSILNYRNMLKKIHQPRSKISTNCEKAESDSSAHDNAIDLTQESDEDLDIPPSSSSSVNPPISRKPINRIFDTDSNDSSNRNNCQVELTTVVEKEEMTVSKNCIDDRNASKSRNSSPGFDRNDERNETKSPRSPYEEKSSPKNAMFSSDLDVFEIDEELLSYSNSCPQRVVASKNSSPISGKSTPRRRDDDPPIGNLINEDFVKSGNNLHHYSVGSSEDTRSPNSLAYRDFEAPEVNEELFTQRLLHSNESPRRNPSSSPNLPLTQKSKYSRSKRKSDAMRSIDTSLENLATENEDQRSTDEQAKESLGSSPERPCFDLLKPNTEIFTRSFKNADDFEKASSPSSQDESPRKAKLRRRSKKRLKTRIASETSASSSHSEKPAKCDKYSTHELSSEASDSKISRQTPESDFSEKNEEIFTQSLKNRDGNSRATSPLSSQETLRIRSPILLSSSPELGLNPEEYPVSDERDSNKENSQKSNESFVDLRQSREDLVDRFSPVHLEELYSPEPCTSRQKYSSRYDNTSTNSVRKLMSRSVSMPESSLVSEINRIRTETPQRKSRMTMSQEFTPPRNYDAMDTPELKRELDKYGIKPQKRKRARQLLNHIYNELHRKVPTASSRTNSPDNDTKEDDGEPPSKRIGRITDRNSNDSGSDRDIPLSQQSSTSPSSSVIPEEMEFPDTNISPKEIAGPISIKEAFVKLMNADKKLHTQVLTYEPLPFEVLFSTLKAQGLKCKQNDLMDFLDEECITFQVLAQSSKSRTRKNRGNIGSKRKDKNHEKNKATENPV